MLLITEIFCHCKSCLSDTHTSSRWLIHLSEYQGRFLQYSGFFHLCPEVVTLTGTLSNSCKNGISAMLCCNVTDQFLNQHGLTYTGTTEQTNLTTFCIRSKKVDNFNTCLKDLYYRALILECRRLSVNYPFFRICNRLSVINCLAEYIK